MAQKYPITKSSCVLDVVDPTDPEQRTQKLDVVLNNIKGQGTENKTLPEQAGDTSVTSTVEVGGVPKGFVFEDAEDLEWTASRVLLQMLFPDTAPYISNDYKLSALPPYRTYVGQEGYSSNTLKNPPVQDNVIVSCLNQQDVTIPIKYTKTTEDLPSSNTNQNVGPYTVEFEYELNTDGITLRSSYGNDTGLKVAKDSSPRVLWDESSKNVKDIKEVVGDLKLTRNIYIIQPEILVKYGDTKGNVKWATCDNIPTQSNPFRVANCCDLGTTPDNKFYYIELYILNENTLANIKVKTQTNGLTASLNDITSEGTKYISLKSGGYNNNPVWEENNNNGTGYNCYRVKYVSGVTDPGRTLIID